MASIFLDVPSGTVELIVLTEGYSKGIPQDGPFTNVRYLVPGNKANEVANRLMGLNRTLSFTTGAIYRQLAHVCPESPALVCVGVGEMEFGGELTLDSGYPKWEWAIVPAAYGFPKFNMSGSDGVNNFIDQNNYFTPTPGDNQAYPWCTFTFDYSVEVLNLPGTAYRFLVGTPKSDGTLSATPMPTGYPIGIRIHNVTIGCSVKQVPWLPANELLTLPGRTNSTTFFGKPPGTILFEGARTSEPFSRDGVSLGTDIDLTFKYRSAGWNTAPLPYSGNNWYEITTNGFAAIEDGGSGTHPYPKTDLRPLIFGVSFS
jgi:hypothetical protein